MYNKLLIEEYRCSNIKHMIVGTINVETNFIRLTNIKNNTSDIFVYINRFLNIPKELFFRILL